MARVRVTRRVHFSAAHRLAREDWSAEQNERVFGACASPNWHGHNYELDVTVEGEVDPETGFVYDLKRLRDRVEERVLGDVDHRNLNLDVPWLKGANPTTENLIVGIWRRLEDAVQEEGGAANIEDGSTAGGAERPDRTGRGSNGRAAARLVRLVLWETPRNYVEYTGE